MFRQLKTNQVALLLHGLRAVEVMDLTEDKQKLVKMLEGELAARGARLVPEDELHKGKKAA
jgi:hypothetical protein